MLGGGRVKRVKIVEKGGAALQIKKREGGMGRNRVARRVR